MSDKSRRQSRKEILPLRSSSGKVVVKENPIYSRTVCKRHPLYFHYGIYYPYARVDRK